MIPGINLLRVANRAIRFQPIAYMRDEGRTTDAVGRFITKRSQPVTLMASVQAVKRDKYHDMGLDFQKEYVKVFASVDVIDIGRDESGDQFVFGHKLYQIESETTWYVQDGWASCLCVCIKRLTQQEAAEYERQRIASDIQIKALRSAGDS
ncbi:hypothetical protein TROPICALSUN_20 [Erwinia phage vB_EamM_TropicalSun]|uniref:Uncharacterized protein n=4 Tax=Myosmarvirus TaxID=2843428 RepID=A0A5B9NNR5_9CAUD|nr:head protein [Serratia phage MyoSmar]QEG09523.1 hypothetical protein CPT_MyoSmar_074 [Serratia phage MyoSmar]QEG13810.1 hypothetical protein TROPICALSUN_20 [Erwinia phage vB_EamM_TropicalSun]